MAQLSVSLTQFCWTSPGYAATLTEGEYPKTILGVGLTVASFSAVGGSDSSASVSSFLTSSTCSFGGAATGWRSLAVEFSGWQGPTATSRRVTTSALTGW